MIKFIVLFIGVVCLLVSAACYARAYWLGRSSLKALKRINRLAALVSHLPDDSSPAWPHVGGGVFGCTGLALVSAALADWIAELGYHLTLEISNLVFALLVAFIAFWTLWQTKRIEQNQAVEMFGFPGLIKQITQEITLLTDEVFKHPTAKFQRFRVLMITTNPFFGQLSYPGEKSTDDFANSMRTASGRAAAKSMRFEILCGDEWALEAFHDAYFRKDGTSDNNKSKAATKVCLEFLSELKGANIHKAQRVPNIQFAVIGNVVLEFILDSGNRHTEIQRYKRTNEKIVADRYDAFFEELTHLYSEIPVVQRSIVVEDAAGLGKKTSSTADEGSEAAKGVVPRKLAPN